MFGSMEISHGPKDIKLRVRPLSSTYCAWLVLSGGQSHCCIQKGGPGQPTLQAAEDQEVWAHPASKFQVEKALTTHFTDEKLDIKWFARRLENPSLLVQSFTPRCIYLEVMCKSNRYARGRQTYQVNQTFKRQRVFIFMLMFMNCSSQVIPALALITGSSATRRLKLAPSLHLPFSCVTEFQYSRPRIDYQMNWKWANPLLWPPCSCNKGTLLRSPSEAIRSKNTHWLGQMPYRILEAFSLFFSL